MNRWPVPMDALKTNQNKILLQTGLIFCAFFRAVRGLVVIGKEVEIQPLAIMCMGQSTLSQRRIAIWYGRFVGSAESVFGAWGFIHELLRCYCSTSSAENALGESAIFVVRHEYGVKGRGSVKWRIRTWCREWLGGTSG